MRRRDPEEKKARLLKAVGELLRERGHRSLTGAGIALQSGVSRKTINRLFRKRDNLIHFYLASHDFWLPRLKEVTVNPAPDTVRVLRLFTEMLQDQLRHFCGNKELRSVILWQISEQDALMRTINMNREEAGNRVMALAEEHFRGTGIDLNWVILYLLGGGYFAALQSDTGNGPACDRDVLHPADLEAGLKTIGQTLELFWWAADRLKKNKLKHKFFKFTADKNER